MSGESDADNNCSSAVEVTVVAGVTRLTNNAVVDVEPAWAPDGGRIAYASSWGSGNYEIHVMNADGSVDARLTNHSAFDYTPRWSPNGARIAFASGRDGNCQSARKMSRLSAWKMSRFCGCPAEGAERPERGSGPGARSS